MCLPLFQNYQKCFAFVAVVLCCVVLCCVVLCCVVLRVFVLRAAQLCSSHSWRSAVGASLFCVDSGSSREKWVGGWLLAELNHRKLCRSGATFAKRRGAERSDRSEVTRSEATGANQRGAKRQERINEERSNESCCAPLHSASRY